MNTISSLDVLAQLLAKVFSAGVAPRHADVSLLVFGDHWKDRELIRDLSGKDIGKLSDEWICNHANYLGCLTANGLRLILPQFAIFSLRNIDSDVTDGVIAMLARLSGVSQLGAEFRGLLTPEQIICFGRYVRDVETHYPMTRSMKPFFDDALVNWSDTSRS